MASLTYSKTKEINQTSTKALEQTLHIKTKSIPTLTNNLNSYLKATSQIFQQTLEVSCKDLESDRIHREAWISLWLSLHTTIHRAPRRNYKHLLVCTKLNYVSTSIRTMDTAPRVTHATLPTEFKNSETIETHYHRTLWWKWWMSLITIIKLNYANFSKKTGNVNIAKNVAMLMEKMSSENHMINCRLTLLWTVNKIQWTAFKNLIIIKATIKTSIQIRINPPN